MMETIRIRGKSILRALGLYDFVIRYGLNNKGIIWLLGLVSRIRWKSIDLIVIVWPPAIPLLDDIQEEIEKMYDVLNLEVIDIRSDGFQWFIQELYAVDYADQKKINLKLERLSRPPHRIGVMTVRIKRPKMAVQDALNRVRCTTVGDLKDGIRRKFREAIPDYVYDIIVHSTEADYQNAVVLSIVRKYRA